MDPALATAVRFQACKLGVFRFQCAMVHERSLGQLQCRGLCGLRTHLTYDIYHPSSLDFACRLAKVHGFGL